MALSVWGALGLFGLGLAALMAGAELFVRGAARLAVALGVPPILIGLTVVAYGTGAPEVAVSVWAAFRGQVELAAGNVVGSNIANILLILGTSAVVAPLAVSRRIVRLDVPLLLAAGLLTFLLALDGRLSRGNGVFLLLAHLALTYFLLRLSRREPPSDNLPTGNAFQRFSVLISLVLLAFGLGALVLGSQWLVAGATELARRLGVSELIIGLSVVAVGTSLPELATSVVAVYRGEREIAVGNVVGSCTFNLLVVFGVAAVVSPSGIPVARSMVVVDMPIMLGAAFAVLPIAFTGRRIDRWEGMIFLFYYALYLGYLLLAAQEHDAQSRFRWLALEWVLPLTAVGLVAHFWREQSRFGDDQNKTGLKR